MTARPTSVVDHMSQPSLMHEPTDPAEPTATLVDADEFDRLCAWATKIEPAPSMGRAYAQVAGRWYATELDGAVSA